MASGKQGWCIGVGGGEAFEVGSAQKQEIILSEWLNSVLCAAG